MTMAKIGNILNTYVGWGPKDCSRQISNYLSINKCKFDLHIGFLMFSKTTICEPSFALFRIISGVLHINPHMSLRFTFLNCVRRYFGIQNGFAWVVLPWLRMSSLGRPFFGHNDAAIWDHQQLWQEFGIAMRYFCCFQRSPLGCQGDACYFIVSPLCFMERQHILCRAFPLCLNVFS